jgi:hypothetical protein
MFLQTAVFLQPSRYRNRETLGDICEVQWKQVRGAVRVDRIRLQDQTCTEVLIENYPKIVDWRDRGIELRIIVIGKVQAGERVRFVPQFLVAGIDRVVFRKLAFI